MTTHEPVGARWVAAMLRLKPDLQVEGNTWQTSNGVSPSEWARKNNIDPELQARALAEVIEVPFVTDLADREACTEFIERVPIGFARQHGVLGLASDEALLPVALGGLEAWPQLDVVSRYLRRPVQPMLATSSAIIEAINVAYQQRTGQAQALVESLDAPEDIADISRLAMREDLLDGTGKAPVVELVNTLLFEAVKSGASDMHIQPYAEQLVIRLRIDGVLFDAFELPKQIQDEAVSRVKVLGQMNIAEKRLPQDGRATVHVGDRLIDLRIASLPTSYGERVVIRLLDKSARIYTLGELGMAEETLAGFRDLIRLEHGLILVTGPTGSGKSTTLYAALQEINAKDRNVVTLEDPIEYQLEGISQTQVSDKKGMTFASGLRSVLRQDPDIIMVGEIRDQETAVMSIQSALTGHLVFSTLHTNDAASAMTRLLDLGIEPYLLASSAVAVMAQRLVRKVCASCSTEVPVSQFDRERLGIGGVRFQHKSMHQGAGCDVCRQTGYRGRIGIFELLAIDEAIRTEIQNRANASRIRDVAVENNAMRLLRDDGSAKIATGTTTIDEVLRVTTRTV